MKIKYIVLTLSMAFGVFSGCSCEHVDQNEIGFAYNVVSGKPVRPENNPQLSFGWSFEPGWNTRHFVINSEVNAYNFTAKEDSNSPYDESLSWDSREGVTMGVDFTIQGRVTDPWKFYANFGTTEYNYGGVNGNTTDTRIYEALRLAGQFVDVRIGEIAEDLSAEEIRRNPAKYADQLETEVRVYAEHFGFTIVDVMFPNAVEFPGSSGAIIQEAREKLRTSNSDLEEKKREVETAAKERDDMIAQARTKAEGIRADGERIAIVRKAEARALAEDMRNAVGQVGVEGAMKLKMAELYGELSESGSIDRAYLTGDSILAQPFYVGSAKKK